MRRVDFPLVFLDLKLINENLHPQLRHLKFRPSGMMAGSGCTNGPRGPRGFRSGGPGVHHVRKETLGGAWEGQSRVPSEAMSHCLCQIQENEAQCVSVSVANLRGIEVILGLVVGVPCTNPLRFMVQPCRRIPAP